VISFIFFLLFCVCHCVCYLLLMFLKKYGFSENWNRRLHCTEKVNKASMPVNVGFLYPLLFGALNRVKIVEDVNLM